METYRNTSSSAGSRGREARAAQTVRSASGASRVADVPRASGARTSTGTAAASARERRRSNFMRYAADNRVIQAIYSLTTGPARFAFYGLVVLAVGIGVYFPVRDLYAAYRTGEILERQLEVRSEYNKGLENEVDSLLSKEGIELAAREKLGLVMPGEHAVKVLGADAAEDDSADGSDGTAADASADDSTDGSAADALSDGAASSDAGDSAASGAATGDDASAAGAAEPKTSNEVEEAEAAVAAESPWYIKVLDAVFFYNGVEGQTVASAGE